MGMPPIERYMTRQPWTTSSQASLEEARLLMRSHQIRHLPVVDDGELVGVVTERDLHILRSVACVSLHRASVVEAMTERVYAVALGAPLDEVVAVMGEHKYGSAIVIDGDGAVAGVFTNVDACRAFAEVLQRAAA